MDSEKWQIFWCFGSPFAGGICDDGPEGIIGPFDTLEHAKAALKAWADSQRCVTAMEPNGMRADCYNCNDALTGYAEIERVPVKEVA